MSTRSHATFDSHRFVKHMTEAGMPLAQAEALAEEQGVMIDTHLATKQDTNELRRGFADLVRRFTDLERRLANVEYDVGQLKVGLAVVKAELAMVKWMVSGVGFGMLLLLVQNFWPV